MTNSDPTVVIVDDDEPVRRSLAFLLETAGFGVCAFASGEEFLGASAIGAHRVALLDVHLPGWDGFEVLIEIRRRSPKLPVIFMTGRPDAAIRERCTELGAAPLLEKPIRHRELLDTIHRVAAAL